MANPPQVSHYRRATASTIEPPCSVLAQQPKRHTNFPGYSCSDTVFTWCVEPRMAGDTTAPQQLAGVTGNSAPQGIWHPQVKFPRKFGFPSGNMPPYES